MIIMIIIIIIIINVIILYLQPKGRVYLMYNDRTPGNKTSSSKAHAKGCYRWINKSHFNNENNCEIKVKTLNNSSNNFTGDLCFDKKSGFWLIHSVPAFPTESYFSYPDSGTIFGQSFICVTFAADSLDPIGETLFFILDMDLSGIKRLWLII